VIDEVHDYSLATADGQHYTVPLAKRIVPGLLLYRLPAAVHPESPYRWRIGHEASGRSIADGMTHEQAIAGVKVLADFADWSQEAAVLQKGVDAEALYLTISERTELIRPGWDDMDGDVSHNGTYSDADIKRYAADCEGLDSLQILSRMAETVPWMGLDTEDFNTVHNRICVLADAS
jgi:hypothetical protein